MPENTPLHISEALRRGLATINLYDQDGKRLPTAYIMSQFSPAFFYDQLKEFAQRASPVHDEKETVEGYYSSSSNTGDQSSSSNTGYYSSSSNTGDQSSSSNTGDRSSSSNTGHRSSSSNTGDQSSSSNTGKQGHALAMGYDSKAMGALGCWITLAEWDENAENIIDMQSAKVDGVNIKPLVFYKLQQGKFVEVKDNE